MSTTDEETSTENVLKRLAQLEDVVQRSGQFNGIDAVEYSDDGVLWTEAWLKLEAPKLGRVRVYRKGVERPYCQPMKFDDALPEADDWRALWLDKPMPLFGAAVKRDGFRHMFRDIVGDYRDPDEKPALDEPGAESAPRDWAAEAEAETSVEKLKVLRAQARQARAFTPNQEGLALKAVFDACLARLEKEAAEVEAEITAWADTAQAWAEEGPDPLVAAVAGKIDGHPAIALSPEEAVRDRAFDAAPDPFAEGRQPLAYELGAPSQPYTGQYAARKSGKRPQDHQQPMNRQARRAGKKGRR